MTPSPPRQPVRSAQAVASPNRGEDETSARILGAVQPGEWYWLACGRRAVLLAHSREKAIPKDPFERMNMTFQDCEWRALHRLGAHPLRTLYETTLFAPIAALVQASGLPWTRFGAYRQGWSPKAEGSVPSIVVWCATMKKPDDNMLQAAQELVGQLDKLLFNHALHDVHAEVAALYTSHPPDPSIPFADCAAFPCILPIYNPILPGNSIGALGGTVSGTYSGYVRIQQPATEAIKGKGAGPGADIFGFTCHQVAAFNEQDPLRPLRAEDNIAMTSPSAADHKGYVDNLERDTATAKAEIDHLETEKEQRMMMEMPWRKHKQEYLDYYVQSQLHNHSSIDHVRACWETNRHLGRVLVSSGIATPDEGKSLEDWALIQLDEARLQQVVDYDWPPRCVYTTYRNKARDICRANKIPELPIPTLDLLIDIEKSSDRDDDAPPTEDEIAEMARQDAPAYVVLRGRSTRFGTGLLHDTRDGVRTAYGPEGNKTEIVSREMTVLDVGVRSHANTFAFSSVGDSGAPVRTLDGRLLGFVLGSNDRDPMGQPTTHIAVAETLAANIQRATGAEGVHFVGRDRALREC